MPPDLPPSVLAALGLLGVAACEPTKVTACLSVVPAESGDTGDTGDTGATTPQESSRRRVLEKVLDRLPPDVAERLRARD